MRDKELKVEDDEASHTLGGAGEGGSSFLRIGKRRGGERFVSGRGECAREAIGAPSMLRLTRRLWPGRGCCQP